MLHRAAFTHREYQDHDVSDDGERQSLMSNIVDSLKPVDIMEDMKGTLAHQNSKVGLDHLLISQYYQPEIVSAGGQARCKAGANKGAHRV